MDDKDGQQAYQWLFNQVEAEIWGSLTPLDELFEDIESDVEDECGGPNPELVKQLKALAQRLLAEQREKERGWTSLTTNDKIDRAFEELQQHGILALQNSGDSMGTGWDDTNEEADTWNPAPRGAVFYHRQDLYQAVAGHGLYLAFGAYEEDLARQDATSLVIAHETVETLARHGVVTIWDGTVDNRIEIPPFTWQKRRSTPAP